MMVSIAVPYSSPASREHAGEKPPTTFGTLWVWNVGLPGSTRSGEKARKKSTTGPQAAGFEHRLHDFIRRPG